MFDLIQKNKEEKVKKEVEARTKAIQDMRESILNLLKEKGFSVQDASITLKTTQEFINGSLISRPLADFV